MNNNELWQSVLAQMQLHISKANFATWFQSTFIADQDEGRVVIGTPSAFVKEWLEDKYQKQILKLLRSRSPEVRSIEFKITQLSAPIARKAPEPKPSEEQMDFREIYTDRETNLNPRYTFENFIVGKGNELAHAAAMAAAANPGESYNPLFIYGGVGLGKTHLLQAIGHHVLTTRPNATVRYLTCERFTNEYIQSVRGGRGKEFKDAYRTVDVLLVDDVQFISGKQGTQEEFFHTFNALHQLNKQIVLSADRSPKDILSLESRLLSRFEWGMTTDISQPDFETRVAILEAKCQGKNYPLTADVLRAIAGTVQSNVRELEGALNKIIAYHQFKNMQPTMETVQTLLQSFLPSVPKRNITPKRLIEIVTVYYDVAMDELLGKSREKRLAFPRQVAMYLLREDAKCSFPAIGTHVGSRDHTTAMHACGKIGGLLKEDEQLKHDIALLREKIYSDQTS